MLRQHQSSRLFAIANVVSRCQCCRSLPTLSVVAIGVGHYMVHQLWISQLCVVANIEPRLTLQAHFQPTPFEQWFARVCVCLCVPQECVQLRLCLLIGLLRPQTTQVLPLRFARTCLPFTRIVCTGVAEARAHRYCTAEVTLWTLIMIRSALFRVASQLYGKNIPANQLTPAQVLVKRIPQNAKNGKCDDRIAQTRWSVALALSKNSWRMSMR